MILDAPGNGRDHLCLQVWWTDDGSFLVFSPVEAQSLLKLASDIGWKTCIACQVDYEVIGPHSAC